MTIQRLSHLLMARVVFALLLSSGAALAREQNLPERVQVSWAPVETLSEIKNNPMQRGWLRPEDWMKTLGEYLRRRADYLLPPGERLEVTIDDIKLAGDFEPWRGPNAQDIRVLKDLYPPRIDVHYKLFAADGSLLRENTGRLRDLSYLQRTVPLADDPLRFDKRLIDDWLRKEFGAAKSD